MKNNIGKPTKAMKLAQAAQAAADVRGYDSNPDVVAYRIERLRARVDLLIWTGLILGLAFTAANVQAFAAHGKETYSIEWWIAWLLDPMVSLVLVGVLLGEQVIARHELVAGAWVRRAKWTALLLTYGMNTWQAWTALDPAAILLHSVPPIIVFCAAEAVTTLRLQITEAVRTAYEAAVRTDLVPVVVPLEVADLEDEPVVERVLAEAVSPGTAEAPVDAPAAEPVPALLPAPPAQTPVLTPAPDDLFPVAADRYADEVATGVVPTLTRIKKDLKVGQLRAAKIRGYLVQLARI